MTFFENVKMAFSSLVAHKMRSILTMLGIIIGVGSVIMVVAIGQGGEAMLKSQITGPGNTIELMYQPSEEEITVNPNIFSVPPFTAEDIRTLENIPEIKRVVASSSQASKVFYHGDSVDSSSFGINQAYFELYGLDIAKGRVFSSSDFLGGRRVAVVSHSFQEELFDGKSPVGKIITVGNQPLEIIGVLEKPSGLFSMNSNIVYIPSNTYRNAFGKNNYNQITLQTHKPEQIKSAGEKAASMLNKVHNTADSYMVFNMEEMAEGLGQITSIMTIIIGSIAGISLFVGGIGVMNIMLVSVTERTREIGIRKALGATRQQILTQFLIEAITLTLIGGLIGILFGWGVSAIISAIADWPSLISWQVVVGGVIFSMFIGIIFGLLPANKASKLDPIEALRYE
ncbi:ABC transporter permease [Bacillus massiliigorillae]|uniref:ABC transporter permease n=1 Tax=Bacillus massiliigorillae TaxID=1243664 RepID=UPI00039E73FE|nr:ABC transporter permease [Bacillus massiliigorillae]